MKEFKLPFLALLILPCALMVYLFFFTSERDSFGVSVGPFAEGRYDLAVRDLNQVRGSLTSSQYQLAMAYIARARNDLPESNKRLTKALEVKQDDIKPETRAEIIFNQALNAYLDHDEALLISILNFIPKNSQVEKTWVTFFKGLGSYLAEDYRDALIHWQEPVPQHYLSPWMKEVFGKIFTPMWYELQLARCEIEERRDLKDQKIVRRLEEILPDASAAQQEEIHLLLGLHFLHEAGNHPLEAEIAHHQVALSFFSKVPMEDPRFQKEWHKLAKMMRQDALVLLQKRAFQDLGLYITALENWHADTVLHELSHKMASDWQQQLGSKQEKAALHTLVIWNQVIGNGELRKSLRYHFENAIFNSLDSGDMIPLEKQWKAVLLLSPDSEKTTENFAKLIEMKIVELIPEDDVQLSCSLPYLKFWSTIEKDQQKRFHFAENIIAFSKFVWLQDAQEEKALAMMRAATELPYAADKKEFHQLLEDMVSQIYRSSLRADHLDSFPYILQAVKEFQLNEVSIDDPSEMANQLADAQYLYFNHRYREALQKALWVLQVQPGHPEAAWIAGMSHYYVGNHSALLHHIQKYADNDTDTAKAYAISHLLVGEESKGIDGLARLEKKAALNEDDYLQIGLGLLIKNKEAESIGWFAKINPPTDAVKAGLAYAYYRLGEWQKSLDHFHELEAPFNKIDGYHGIAILDYLALGQIDKAEEILVNLLKRDDIQDRQIPLYFQSFKHKKLDPIDRYFIAAQFYSKYPRNPSQAIHYFERVTNPTAEMLLARAKMFADIGRTQDAIGDLEQALDRDSEGLLQLRIVPLLATFSVAEKQYIEGAKYYGKLMQLKVGDRELQSEYANALMHIRHFDKAKEQYEEIRKTSSLKPLEREHYIEALVHTDHFAEADVQMNLWLQDSPSPTAFEKFKLLTLARITQNKELVSSLQKLDESLLTEDQKRSLVRFFMEQGEYNRAQAMAKTNQETLSSYSSVNENAEGHLAQLESLVQKYPGRVTWQLQYAETLAKWAAESKQTALLKKARLIADQLAQENPDIPEILFHQARIHYALDDDLTAEKALRRAVEIDSSYSEAYKLLGMVYRDRNQLEKAIEMVNIALKYSPFDADTYQELAAFQEKQGQLLEAITNLEYALKYKPDQLNGYLALAHLYLKIQNPLDAFLTCECALKYYPDHPTLLTLLVKILDDTDLRRRAKTIANLDEKKAYFLKKVKDLKHD